MTGVKGIRRHFKGGPIPLVDKVVRERRTATSRGVRMRMRWLRATSLHLRIRLWLAPLSCGDGARRSLRSGRAESRPPGGGARAARGVRVVRPRSPAGLFPQGVAPRSRAERRGLHVLRHPSRGSSLFSLRWVVVEFLKWPRWL
jgi:hypothetical protein